MRVRDLHILPKLRDGLGYLYLERGKIAQSQKAVEFFDKEGRTLLPVASLACLLLGPGTSITHEAVKRLTDNGCSVVWSGISSPRFYLITPLLYTHSYRLSIVLGTNIIPPKRNSYYTQSYLLMPYGNQS